MLSDEVSDYTVLSEDWNKVVGVPAEANFHIVSQRRICKQTTCVPGGPNGGGQIGH